MVMEPFKVKKKTKKKKTVKGFSALWERQTTIIDSKQLQQAELWEKCETAILLSVRSGFEKNCG